MKISQLLPTLSFGDAVGNDTLAIQKILREEGYESEIYAENIDRRLSSGQVSSVEKMPGFKPEDILIYHASTGTKLNALFPTLGGKKVMIYHNITPPAFFAEYSPEAVRLTESGYAGIRSLADKVQFCIADSEYNRQELIKMGYTCPIEVCPIVIPFEDYDRPPDPKVMKRYQGDGFFNLLFVGRIAPNKRQEDVIRAFYCYQKRYNPRSRLFLAGSCQGMERYGTRLKSYVRTLGLEDRVIFPGQIKFPEILAYYRLADVFVCMSEHEGFCVPLAEAMHLGKPIVAYRSSAVPETLSGGGLLLDSKDPWTAAAAIHRVAEDEALRAFLAEKQRARLAALSYPEVKKRFLACLKKAI